MKTDSIKSRVHSYYSEGARLNISNIRSAHYNAVCLLAGYRVAPHYCFNGIGKCVSEHVAKSAMIMVTGRIHYPKWTDNKNVTHYGCEIIAKQVDFLSKAGRSFRNYEVAFLYLIFYHRNAPQFA